VSWSGLALLFTLAIVFLTLRSWARSPRARVLRDTWPVWLGVVIGLGFALLSAAYALAPGLLDPRLLPVIVLLVVGVAWWRWRGLRRVTKLLERGELDAALALATHLVRRRPAHAGCRNLLGLVHLRREEWADAIQAFSAAERLAGRADAVTDPMARAVDAFGERALSPLAAACVGNRGIALWKSGRPAAARPLLEEVRSALPKEPFFALQLCALLLDLGQAADAAAELRRVEEIGKLPPALAEQRDALRARLEGQA